MKDTIKALIVDDSAFMRKSLSIFLSSDPDIEIVGTAKDGIEAYEMAKKLNPDVITLDIEMPRMDGLTALKKIMADCPTSVIMVSSLTTEGADATIKAMELGAVDFIPKEMSFVSVNIVSIKEDLVRKVKAIARKRFIKSRYFNSIKAPVTVKTVKVDSSGSLKQLPKIPYKAVALGISTGGPLSLQKIIPKLSGKISAPIFIVQHMPPKFTKSLADRLNDLSELEVKEAETGEAVKNGTIYIAPGGQHMKFVKKLGSVIIDIGDTPAGTLHKPSVDVMMGSAVEVYGKSLLGVIMTGMGKDGLEAVRLLKGTGGYCLAQDEESCIVYGMPKAVVDAGFADVIAPLDKIPELLNEAL